MDKMSHSDIKLPTKRRINILTRIDRLSNGNISFFVKNIFKTKFMMSMSKKAQVLGLEKLYNMGPKAFFLFFIFYLVRDTILYIIIPIYIAKCTGQ